MFELGQVKNLQFDEKNRKHCGKRRNCSSQTISPFATEFSKDLLANSFHYTVNLYIVMYDTIMLFFVCESFINVKKNLILTHKCFTTL